jgi:hypothetical protein
MKHIQKTIKKLQHKDDAVAGIIVAVLLIALVISVVAIIQTVFVPQWMEQKEAEHMQNVFNQFTMLKYCIDTQALTKDRSLALTTSITLGNKELPILHSTRSYGYLMINETRTELKVREQGSQELKIEQTYGMIQYSSNNAYFLDRTYIYEAGALIVRQSEGDIMAISPAMELEMQENNIIRINFSLINTRGIGERRHLGGYGTYPVRAQFNSFEQRIVDDVAEIHFPTSNKNSWLSYFQREFRKHNIAYEGGNAICSIETTNDGIKIIFNEGECTARLNFNIFHINVEFSSGWIE